METKIFQKVGNTIAKNSPSILTGVAVAGLLSTVAEAVRATPKALQILEEEKLRRVDPDSKIHWGTISKKDVIKLTWKCYVPTTILATITIGCIISANSINKRRNAALAGLYSISEMALKEYRDKVVETIGENKERKIKDEIAADKIRKTPVNEDTIEYTGKGDTLCYDAFSGRYFKSNIEHIRSVLNDLSRDLLSDMFISLNQVYYGLDLPGTKLGDLVGWHVEHGLIEPQFSSQLTEDGKPCLVLDFSTEPKYNCYD